MTDEETARANYEASLRERPNYETGEPRLTWDELVAAYGENIVLVWSRDLPGDASPQSAPVSHPRED